MSEAAAFVEEDLKTLSGRAESSHVIARKSKMLASLDGFRAEGTQLAAGRAAGVAHTTIQRWWRKDPDYRAAVAEALEEYAQTVGLRYHSLLAEHAAEVGTMVVTKQGVENGREVCLKERVTLNPALARLALTRADPRFTHPKKEVEHSHTLTLDEAAKAAMARLEAQRTDTVTIDAEADSVDQEAAKLPHTDAQEAMPSDE